jgi:3'-phosphoadenosine 5'-phosphosulfate sulfotransferase (PAPS reductase)/FAD synthetase
MTSLAAAGREAGIVDRPVRILNVMGMRAQESPSRAAKAAYRYDASASNGRRHVDEWLPIHDWTEDDVWADIRESGAPSHPAYEAGMPRLSCRFCVLASKDALVLSAQLNPELAQKYLAVEEKIGHSFKNGLSMAQIIEEAASRPPVTTVADWNT